VYRAAHHLAFSGSFGNCVDRVDQPPGEFAPLVDAEMEQSLDASE